MRDPRADLIVSALEALPEVGSVFDHRRAVPPGIAAAAQLLPGESARVRVDDRDAQVRVEASIASARTATAVEAAAAAHAAIALVLGEADRRVLVRIAAVPRLDPVSRVGAMEAAPN